MEQSTAGSDTYLVQMIGRSVVQQATQGTGVAKLTPASQQLLALLVAAGPEGLTTDHLADELWGELLPNSWRASLRMAISRLRRVLSKEAVVVAQGRASLSLEGSAVDVWDLRHLADQGLQGERPERLGHLLHSPRVYSGVEVSPAIEESLQRASAAQRSLISELVDLGGAPLSRDLLASLRMHAEADPFDSRLAQVVAKAHASAGYGSVGIKILQDSLETQQTSLGLGPDADSERVLDAIRQSSEGFTVEAVPRRAPRMPSLLGRIATHPVVGQLSDVALIKELGRVENGLNRTVLVDGRSGSGKTQLLACIADDLVSSGVEVVYVPGLPEAAAPYASFSAALPEIAAAIDAWAIDSELTAGAKQSAVWNGVLDAILRRADGRPVAVLVDDGQWVDSQERKLLEFLTRTQIESGSLTVVAGRATGEADTWVELRQAMSVLPHVEVLHVEPLDWAAMVDFVALHRPDLNPMVQSRLVDQLMKASDGVPEVARALLDWADIDSASLRVDVADDQVTRLRRRLEESLDQQRLDFISACSVKGQTFTLEDASGLAGIGGDEALGLIDDLLDAHVLAESTAPDTFRFEHLLVSEAAASLLSRSEARRLELRAAEITANPHERARHFARALPGGDPDVAAEALFASASLHATKGAHWEAVADLDLLQQRCGRDLSTEQRVLYAGSLARIGRFEAAREQREIAFSAAIGAQAWSVAMEAVSAGLPEAELPGEEQDRVVLALKLLDTVGLEDSLAKKAHELVARHAAMAGEPEHAVRAISELERMAADASDRSSLILAKRHVSTFKTPAERLQLLESADPASLSADGRLSLDLYFAIDHMEAGDMEKSRKAYRRFAASASREPLYVWQSLLFESVFPFTTGDWSGHGAAVEKAFAYAQRYGIAVGSTARMAQYVLAAWVGGALQLIPPDMGPIGRNAMTLERAGRALVADAHGDRDLTVSLVDGVLADLDGSPDPQWVTCAAMLADIVRRRGSVTDASFVRSILDTRLGSAVVVGAGLGNLGPADRYAGLVASDPVERAAHLERAADLASEWRMTMWEEVNRRDAAEAAEC